MNLQAKIKFVIVSVRLILPKFGAYGFTAPQWKSDVRYKFHLKTVSSRFWLVCFLSLKESACEAGKNVSYFTSKALFILEKIEY